ncbi:FecR domain-containing protein [Psychroserpens algicola]|uniref:FecR domain-containing protein n=1 Tax=Psychroserpens algicola TaxID=1719034 RepID=A0ABT0HCD9_9FLAO|nr:FecR domain-containing protein [Psychroserpens algicola]MCK8482031.1 FecR domain-containing protein [Psychroserpens algicola]
MNEEQLHNENDTFLAQWLAGDLSDDQLKNMVSESDFKAFLKIRKGIETYEVLEGDGSASFSQIQDKISLKKSKVKSLNNRSWWIGVAASIVLLFGLFLIRSDQDVKIATNYGEQKTIELLDGSQVVLNSKSTLVYNTDEWQNNRTLMLKGEAYFKVKKGSTFTVTTENGNVSVLGTQFNVNSVSDLFEVACFEGKVSVQTQEEDYILTPSNAVRRINGYAVETWKTTLDSPSWIDGESSFTSVPLSYVISALESQYNIKIDSKNIDQTLVYTGSFTHKDLDIALQTVFKSLEIRYIEKEKGNIYLSTK